MTRARDTAGIIQYSNITIDSNNAVGIGSSIPDAKLDVNGNLFVTGIASASNLNITGISTLGGSLDVNGTNHDINGAIAVDVRLGASGGSGIGSVVNVQLLGDVDI